MIPVFLAQQEVKPNHYITPSELDLGPPPPFPPPGPPAPGSLHSPASTSTLASKYYSTGSLQRPPYYKDTTKMTVKEATLKRDSMLRNNQMRTNLMLQTNDY